MSFGQPLLLLTLLVVPAVVVALLLVERRRARYAVRFTNLDVLAGVVAKQRPWRRYVAPVVFLLALAALCVAMARPHVSKLVLNQEATVILVVDVSGSMHATDVSPTRLGAAQHAVDVFLDHAPKQLRVGLVAFAGEPDVVTPPTTDHALVREGADTLGYLQGYGGTAIGDALAAAVQLAQQAVGATKPASSGTTIAFHPGGAQSPASILILSDGAQTHGVLQPAQGAAIAKAAGIRVYSVSVGTPDGVLQRGYNGSGGFGGYSGTIPVPVDPSTLREVAAATGGKFSQARTASSLDASYASLGSRLGRKPGQAEITNELVLLAALLLIGAGLVSALWAPRLP
jgi:Ca-activated chloride channel homolog